MKSRYLYHASKNKNLSTISPMRTVSKDRYIGDFVFAAKKPVYTAMYLANPGLYKVMNAEASPPRIIIGSDADEYIADDRGGSIYTVPAEHFIKSPQAGLTDTELVTDKKIKPIAKKVYRTSLEAFKEYGIAVYFVSNKMMQKILRDKNEQEVIQLLKPYQY